MDDELQMMQFPVISSRHVTRDTMKALALVAAGVRRIDGVVSVFDLVGDASAWLVRLDELPDAPDALSLDLAALREWALQHDTLWVKLDRDGDTVAGLAHYD